MGRKTALFLVTKTDSPESWLFRRHHLPEGTFCPRPCCFLHSGRSSRSYKALLKTKVQDMPWHATLDLFILMHTSPHKDGLALHRFLHSSTSCAFFLRQQCPPDELNLLTEPHCCQKKSRNAHFAKVHATIQRRRKMKGKFA